MRIAFFHNTFLVLCTDEDWETSMLGIYDVRKTQTHDKKEDRKK